MKFRIIATLVLVVILAVMTFLFMSNENSSTPSQSSDNGGITLNQ